MSHEKQHTPAVRALAVRHAWLCSLALVLLACGCGQKSYQRVEVRGQVTVDGNLLPAGTIEFRPEGEDPGPTAAAPIKGGRFELLAEEGPVAGPLEVRIVPQADFSFEVDDEEALAKAKAEGKVPSAPPARVTFADPSRQKLVLSEDATDLKFELVTAAGR